MDRTAFWPPRCPNRRCRHHLVPAPHFCTRHGSYRPRCRQEAVPRFRCKACRLTFSRQTFRIDYRDRRPECNVPLLRHLVSGGGLRQGGRLFGLSAQGVQRKFRKLARQVRLLNRNLLRRLPAGRTFVFDELETYEQSSIRPVTVPVLVDKQDKLVVAVGVAPIRRVARRGSRRHRWLQRYEQEHGRQPDLGHRSVRRVLARLRHLLDGRRATLVTDQKASYAALCQQHVAGEIVHEVVSSRALRTAYNPLFAVNLTEAMLRDNSGRLRRRTWLVSQRRSCLLLQLHLFQAYRNWTRQRTNKDPPELTPGVAMGLLHGRLGFDELVAWRQDWRLRSIHPASCDGRECVGQAA